MKFLVSTVFCLWNVISVFAQDGTDTLYKRPKDTMDFVVNWTTLADGISFCETDAPLRSKIGDSKITLLKIDPKKVDFELITTTGLDSVSRPVNFWADTMNLNIVFNAGMYDLAKPLISRGLLKNDSHVNQYTYKEGWNMMFALNPKEQTGRADAKIYDMQCKSYDQIKNDYRCFAQGIRMMDCSGTPLFWKKNSQSCSMMVCAMDEHENLIILFTRSPYTANQMIRFMKQFPTPLHNAIYMEGGPETSLYVHVEDFCLQKVGSYVSNTYPKDTNESYWKLPNVIGVRLKK